MATYKAEIKTVPTGGQFTVTTESGSISTAREQIEKLYDPIYIYNLRECRGDGNSSSIGDVGGGVALVGVIAAGWAFLTFAPWVLMLVGGATGTWIGEKVTGKSIDEITDSGTNTKAGAILLSLMMLGGGVGFVKGHEFQTYMNTPDSVEVQQQK